MERGVVITLESSGPVRSLLVVLTVTTLVGLSMASPAAAAVSGQNGQIAFTGGGEGGNSEILVVNPDGSGLTNLTNHPATDGDPAWSPDGREIALTSDRDGASAIWVMGADGSNLRRLTAGSAPTWSPEGKRIAFVRDGAIWVLTIGGSAVKITTPTVTKDLPDWVRSVNHHTPAWSPDGREIAFARHLQGPTPLASHDVLMVMRPDGSGVRQVPNVSGKPLASIDWSPDGSRLVLVEGGFANLSDYVVVVGSDGSDHTMLPIPAGYDMATVATWAPDGKLILAGFAHTLAMTPSQLFVMRPDGSNQVGLGLTGPPDLDWQALNPYPVGAMDPSTGLWHLRYSDASVTSFYYGNPGDSPFMGDWDCDGVDTPGLYRPSDGFVYLRNSNTQGVADRTFYFGNPGDVPIAGDFNGDGCDTVSIYRPSEQRFYIIDKLGSAGGGLGAAEYSFMFGNPGDKPFAGDFDGDGIDEVALHRESTGRVYLRYTLTTGVADLDFIYGNPGDRLIAHDWNGDGLESPAVFRPANQTFYFRFTNTQGNANAQYTWGQSHWLPVAGDFD